jgi:Flp pilus assembly protein TadB
MGLAVLLIIAGILIWLLLSPIIGIILLVVGLLLLLWAGMSFRGEGSRRYYW